MRRSLLILAALVLVALAFPATAANPPEFQIIVRNLDTTEKAGEANYVRNLPSGATWLDGDRITYRCAYTFLRWQGSLVGRVTFVRLAGYAQVNDRYMAEGLRRLDGTLNPPGTGQSPTTECPVPNIAYEPDESIGPLPVLVFSDGQTTLETRNYANIREVGPTTEFQIVSHAAGSACDRVGSDGLVKATAFECFTVLIYQGGLPIVAAYYDRISENIQLTANFTSPPPPLPPEPDPTPVTLDAGLSALTCIGGTTPLVAQADPLLVTC